MPELRRHFQRPGQGAHAVLGQVLRALAKTKAKTKARTNAEKAARRARKAADALATLESEAA